MKILIKILLISILSTYTIAAQDLLGIEGCLEAKVRSSKNMFANAKQQGVLWPGDDRIDVNYYKLELDFDYSYNATATEKLTNKKMKAVATIKAKITQNNVSEFWLDLATVSLTVDSVFFNGVKQSVNHTNNKLTIVSANPLNINSLFTVKVYYQGLPTSTGFGTFQFTTHPVNSPSPRGPAIWTLSEPFGAADWFPCKNNPADKADSSDVWITAPKEMVSVSNGILEEKIEGTTTNTYKWKSRYPIAQYLISLAISNYNYMSNTYSKNGISFPIEHYLYPETDTPATRTQLLETDFCMNVFIDKFGPYPFAKERYAHAQFGWGGGMEHQTCSSMGSFGSGLIAHELAHQWFGDLITCADWSNIWLNEGFASLGALLYREAKNGKNDYKAGIISTMTGARNAVGSIYVPNINPANGVQEVSRIFNGNRTYSKAGIVLHMLRNIMGEDKFFEGVKAYTSSILAYGNANTEQFQSIMESVYGQSLQYFFQQWIYGEKYPKYQFGWFAFPPQNGRVQAPVYRIRLRINQLANTNPSFFTMPIDLKVSFSDNTSTTRRVFNNMADQYIDLEFDKPVSNIEFDPENAILKELEAIQINVPLSLEEDEFNKVLAEEIWTAQTVKIGPNPTSDVLKIRVETDKTPNISINLYNQKGQFLLSNELAKSNELYIGHLQAGMYFVEIKAGKQRRLEKIVKQ